MFARAGLLIMIAVDIAMTGRAGATELAYYGLAVATFVVLMVAGIGMIAGTGVLTAQAEGAGKPEQCGNVWRVSLAHGTLIGFALAAVCYGGESFYLFAGQNPALAEGAGSVLVVFGWGMPAILVFASTTLFLEGINRPMAGLIVMIAANVVNVGLNWVLIYGNLGLPALGAEGAVLATTIVRWLNVAVLAAYVLLRTDKVQYGLIGPIIDCSGVSGRLRRIGYPIALTYILESGAFACMTLFAGTLGTVQVAGFQVVMNLVTLVFMFALGVATAASVRVGNAVGRGSNREVRQAGWMAVALAASVLVIFAAILYLLPDQISRIYTNDTLVIAVTVPALAIAAIVILVDGMKEVLSGALRGAADVWPTTLVNFVSFWVVMIPLGYVLAIERQGNATGLIAAVAVGGSIAAVALAFRFHQVARRPVAGA